MGPRPETIVAQDDEFPAGAVVPPIFQTSLFTFPSYEELEATFAGDTRRPIYSRGDNPTVQVFEAKLAALEVAETARAFASGMAAISAAVLSNLRTGERMVCVRHCYPDAFRLFRTILPRFGIDVEFVDGRDANAVERALPGARVLYLESPTSMVFETQDLARLAILKTWPIRGSALMRGEILAPAVVLTVVVWLLMITAVALSASELFDVSGAPAGRWSIPVAVMILDFTDAIVGVTR